MAITIDDLDVNADDTSRLNLDQRNEAIINALSRSRLKAALFVCGMRVDNEAGRRHLAAWSGAGHIIGNHTYSHFNYPNVGFEKFSNDVVRGEEIIRDYPGFRKLPLLHGVDPYTYLVDVLQRVAIHPASRVAELTPRLWKQRFAGNPMRSDLHGLPA